MDGDELRAGASFAAEKSGRWEGTVVRVLCVVDSDGDRVYDGADEECWTEGEQSCGDGVGAIVGMIGGEYEPLSVGVGVCGFEGDGGDIGEAGDGHCFTCKGGVVEYSGREGGC